MKYLDLQFIYILSIWILTLSGAPDYWDDDFDMNKNCKEEELISQLKQEQDQGKCSSKTSGII